MQRDDCSLKPGPTNTFYTLTPNNPPWLFGKDDIGALKFKENLQTVKIC